MELIAKYRGDIRAMAARTGVEAEILSENYAILTAAEDKSETLLYEPEIEYLELPKIVSPQLYNSLRNACVSVVQGSMTYSLRGAGVIVAIIDSGIDYTHPDFRNEDGTSRLLYIWDQAGEGTPPGNFSHGAEFTQEMLNEALASPEPGKYLPFGSPLVHGTAVAGVAAGNGAASDGRECGVAPEASIIAVRLGSKGRESFARTTEIMRAIKYVYDKAEQLLMPIAVNISYGTNNGAHDGHSLFETYIDEMASQYKSVIVAASGNEGRGGHHYSAKVTKGEWKSFTFSTAANLRTFYMTIWKNFADTISFELEWPDGYTSPTFFPEEAERSEEHRGVNFSVFYGQPTHYTAAQEINLTFAISGADDVIPEGIWRIGMNGLEITDGLVDAWLPTTEEVTEYTAFLEPDPDVSLTLPSTSQSVVTVGAYDANINAAADFSGKGYTRGSVYIKPDICAPGVNILTCSAGGGYDTFSGTSLAAPFVTGAAACIMEWGIVRGNDPFLYGQRIKAFLQRCANRRPDIDYPNSQWGYGTLCLRKTIDDLMRYV